METILDDMKIELGKIREFSQTVVVNVYDKDNMEIIGDITLNTTNLKLREKVINLLKMLET